MPDDLRRLHPSGPISRGLSVDTDGAMLGPDCVLVRRGPNGYLTADRAEAATIQQLVFGGDRRPDWLFDHCCRIAKALNDGQIALAQIYGVHSAPNDLDHKRQAKLAKAAILIKANFNPDQPRVPAGNPDGGQWMTAGEVSSDHLKPRPAADGAWSGYIDAAWNGDYHQYLVQYFADITRAAGGAAVTEVPLVAIDGTRARADLIVRPKEASEPFAIEIKTGTDWQLKLNQQRIYEMLPLGGHVTANKEGLEKLGLVSGRPLPPMRTLFVVTVGPGRDFRYGWWPPE